MSKSDFEKLFDRFKNENNDNNNDHDNNNENENENENKNENEDENKNENENENGEDLGDQESFSKDEVLGIIDSKLKDWQKDEQSRLEEEKRKAKLSAEELQEERIRDLESQIRRREIEANVAKNLSEQGIELTDRLSALLITDDKDETAERVDTFVGIVGDQVAKVKKKTSIRDPLSSGSTHLIHEKAKRKNRDLFDKHRLI